MCLLSMLSVAAQTQAFTVMNFEDWSLVLGNFVKQSCFISVALPVVWCESGYHGVRSAGRDKCSQQTSALCHRLCCGFSLSGFNSHLGRSKVVGKEDIFYLNIKQF